MLAEADACDIKTQTPATSTTPATSRMKLFVTIINSLQPLNIAIKCSMSYIAEVLDSSLAWTQFFLRKNADKVNT